MGQRAAVSSVKQSKKYPEHQQKNTTSYWTIFPTELGWFGVQGQGGSLCRLLIGQTSERKIREHIQDVDLTATEKNWNPKLQTLLQQYAEGKNVCFDGIPLALPTMTSFQKRVIAKTQQLLYGQTVTYGILAEQAGSPKAARAVGSVMSSNRIPIIIPCHRVIGANGHLGGFSAPQGVTLKQRMLQMEAS